MAEVPEALKADIKRYQDVAERLRVIAINKQQLQVQLSEIDEALRELGVVEESAPVYKVVGSIVVLRKKADIVGELSNSKELLEIRMKALEKQEELLRKQLDELERRLARKLGSGAQAGAG